MSPTCAPTSKPASAPSAETGPAKTAAEPPPGPLPQRPAPSPIRRRPHGCRRGTTAARVAALEQSGDWVGEFGRSGQIRTDDPLTPSQVRYQAALHSDGAGIRRFRRRAQPNFGVSHDGASRRRAAPGDGLRERAAVRPARIATRIAGTAPGVPGLLDRMPSGRRSPRPRRHSRAPPPSLARLPGSRSASGSTAVARPGYRTGPALSGPDRAGVCIPGVRTGSPAAGAVPRG